MPPGSTLLYPTPITRRCDAQHRHAYSRVDPGGQPGGRAVNLGVGHGQLASYNTASVACRGIKEEAAGVAMVREIEHVAQAASKRVK